MSAIWFALVATVLMGFAGLASDTGVIWVNRSLLQNSVDAAALAGAQDLSPLSGQAQGKTNATTTACNFATQLNTVSGMDGKIGTCSNKADVTFPDGSSIKVTAYKTIQPMFGAVLGFAPAEVHASATAKVGSLKSSSCYFPLFQTKSMMQNAGIWDAGSGIIKIPPVATKLKNSSGNSSAVLLIDVNGSSSSADWRNAVSSPDGCSHETLSLGSTIPADPGAIAGPLNTAMTNRRNLWNAQGNCVQPDPTKSPYTVKQDGTVWNGTLQLNTKNCYRMVLMPIGDQENKPVKVVGYATFWIGGWCDNQITCSSTPPANLTMGKNEIWGYFVGFAAPGGVDYGTYDGFGTKVVALAN